jgi:hypothetical protein
MPKRTNDGLKKRCKCGRRKWAKCSHPWHFSFHYRGREHRYSLDAVARSRNQPLPKSKTEAETADGLSATCAIGISRSTFSGRAGA